MQTATVVISPKEASAVFLTGIRYPSHKKLASNQVKLKVTFIDKYMLSALLLAAFFYFSHIP
jgi:hypothetical protein